MTSYHSKGNLSIHNMFYQFIDHFTTRAKLCITNVSPQNDVLFMSRRNGQHFDQLADAFHSKAVRH